MLERLGLFPDSTHIENGSLKIGGMSLADLAEQYGTPLYIYDRATMDGAASAYEEALGRYYPGEAQVTYAGKAFLCVAIAEWIRERGLWADCTGEAELEMARVAGVPRETIVAHGVNKSDSDRACAVRQAGTLVVDNLTEVRSLVPYDAGGFPSIWLRWLPGLAVTTHHRHTQTGQTGSKFGMTTEELEAAARLCRAQQLPLNGLHFHQGSNFRDPAPLVAAVEMATGLAKRLELGERWHFCPGGGWGVAYHEDELPQPSIDEYVRLLAQTTATACQKRGLPLPVLHLEPGRSLVARAGVAIYRIGTIKQRSEQDGGTWLLLDGGMADNPRHALYGTRYSCLPVRGAEREATERVSMAGPYCESGDVLIENLRMPRQEEGELVAIPASGAYQLSMASNYNGARRPAVAWLEEGRARLIVRRETVDDLLRRDVRGVATQTVQQGGQQAMDGRKQS